MTQRILAFLLLLCWLSVRAAATPEPRQSDFFIPDFKFRSGEVLPTLRIHYRTLGEPHRDAAGHVDNAVLILHGTGGSGAQFLRPQFAGVLFVAGGLLDPARYFIILPDDIGHGQSSKPSDGLHARFPHYDYDDMVEAEHALVNSGLHVDRLRLAMGTSMGCMHLFVMGETYPGFAQALMPLACLPVQIAGRNRMWRRMIMDVIESDPAWQGGEYKTEPAVSLRAAADILLIAGSAPQRMQAADPTRDAADRALAAYQTATLKELDANDLAYQVAASRNYDPSAKLSKITVPVMWINSADDFINPPELGIAERMAPLMPHARFVLLPIGTATHGHGTHTWAASWQSYLAGLLGASAGANKP